MKFVFGDTIVTYAIYLEENIFVKNTSTFITNTSGIMAERVNMVISMLIVPYT